MRDEALYDFHTVRGIGILGILLHQLIVRRMKLFSTIILNEIEYLTLVYPNYIIITEQIISAAAYTKNSDYCLRGY